MLSVLAHLLVVLSVEEKLDAAEAMLDALLWQQVLFRELWREERRNADTTRSTLHHSKGRTSGPLWSLVRECIQAALRLKPLSKLSILFLDILESRGQHVI